VIKSTLVFC